MYDNEIEFFIECDGLEDFHVKYFVDNIHFTKFRSGITFKGNTYLRIIDKNIFSIPKMYLNNDDFIDQFCEISACNRYHNLVFTIYIRTHYSINDIAKNVFGFVINSKFYDTKRAYKKANKYEIIPQVYVKLAEYVMIKKLGFIRAYEFFIDLTISKSINLNFNEFIFYELLKNSKLDLQRYDEKCNYQIHRFKDRILNWFNIH